MAAATAAAAAVASASSATTASKALATTTAFGTIGLRLGFVDRQRPSSKVRPIKRGNGGIRLGGIGHFHEPETARAARFAVGDQRDFLYRSVRLENIAQFGLGCAVGQIADV